MAKRKQRKIDVEARKLNQKVYNLRSSYKRFGLNNDDIKTIKGISKKSYKELRSEIGKTQTMLNRSRKSLREAKQSGRATIEIKHVNVRYDIGQVYLKQVRETNKRREELGRVAYEIAKEVGEIGLNITYEQFYEMYSSGRGFSQETLKSTVYKKDQDEINEYFIQSTNILADVKRKRAIAYENLQESIEQLVAQGVDSHGMAIYSNVIDKMSDSDFDLFLASFEQASDTYHYLVIDFGRNSIPIWNMLDKMSNQAVFSEYFTDEDREYIDNLLNDNINKYEEGKMIQSKQAMQKTLTSNKK